MFDLELLWDRPAKISSQSTTHVLRSRIYPQSVGNALPSLPLRIAIALDTSQSMQGEKLQCAKEACRAVVSHLRDTDRLFLAGFSTRVTPLLQSLTGGANAVSSANTAIASLQPEGVTRTDLALEWIQNALPKETGVTRVGILITDGHATTPQGNLLDDVTPLINQSSQLSSAGIVLCTVGLGDAANFNTAFLTDLSDKGRGAFLYADTPTILKSLLQERLAACQAIATEEAKLRFTLSSGVTLKGFCRFRPEYLPLEETAKNELTLGTIGTNSPTDVLIDLEIPASGFGEPMGSREVVSVQLTARGMTNPITKTAAITYTNSYSEAQKVNAEVNNDRLCWDINVYSNDLTRTNDPKRTGELLDNIQFTATQAGQANIANQAAQQLDDLKKTGVLNPHKSTGLLRDSRNLGGTK